MSKIDLKKNGFVWFGLVWFGLVQNRSKIKKKNVQKWFGLVWFGMVWYGKMPKMSKKCVFF